MYTQCPNCEFASKVTADDLKQAGGQILCGTCGKAFSALSYLSEKRPEQPVTKRARTGLPELNPEIPEADDRQAEAVFAEQSAAFMKTLDDLSGSDVRILDTGAEWRVLDEEEASAAADSPVNQLRFDDNTPLPDDFGANEETSVAAKSESAYDAIDEDDDNELLDEQPQPGVALSDPNEWTDILGEFLDLAKEVAAPVEGVDDEGDTAIQFNKNVADESISDETPGDEAEEEPQDDQSNTDGEVDWNFDDEIEQLDLIEEQARHEKDSAIGKHAIENELAAKISGHHYVPAMTEEEHTVNMQIDQDLMALAVEDQDGFISTIIIADEDSKKKTVEMKRVDEDDEFGEESVTAPGFETIIMEGETIRTAFENMKLAEPADFEPIDISREDETGHSVDPGGPRYGMIAALVLLVLTLATQLVHQSRETLATIPAFSKTIGQIYRAIGQPVQPAWDITGWRFEATKGSTEGENDELTVYSRLGNNSAGPLPYPLIGISLTDRFEESIGSRVLDPAEYLPSNLDPRKLVERGDTFNAVITIKSASADATGFKLNVCYRSSDERLRCAINDFK